MPRWSMLVVAVLALSPRWAVAEVRVGLLPVVLEGQEVDEAAAAAFERALASGLEAAGLRVVLPESLREASGWQRDRLAACTSAECLSALAEASEIQAVVRAEIGEEYDFYTFNFETLSITGDSIASHRGDCEVCTTSEAAETLAREAEVLGRETPRTGRVRISIEPPQATVRVDGEVRDERELDLGPGPHTIQASSEGWDAHEETFEVTLGSELRLSFSLEPAEGSPTSIPGRMGPLGIAGWTLTGVGAALAVVGIVLAVLDGRCAGGERDANGECELIYVEPTLAIGLGLLGGGVALVGTGVALGLIERSRRHRSQARPAISLALAPRRHMGLLASWIF